VRTEVSAEGTRRPSTPIDALGAVGIIPVVVIDAAAQAARMAKP
jgi:hypothetical protein